MKPLKWSGDLTKSAIFKNIKITVEPILVGEQQGKYALDFNGKQTGIYYSQYQAMTAAQRIIGFQPFRLELEHVALGFIIGAFILALVYLALIGLPIYTARAEAMEHRMRFMAECKQQGYMEMDCIRMFNCQRAPRKVTT